MTTTVNNKQDLLQQLLIALEQNDEQTLKILLEDQTEQLIQQFQARLTDEKLKKSFDKFIVQWRINNLQRKNIVDDQDKIRKINANQHKQQSQNEENIIHKQIAKKKPVKLERKFGYDFYGNIKCLMTAYGDHEPREQSVKMMHSQTQILCQNLIKFILQTEVSKKMTEALIRQNIELVFKQEVTSFEQITKQYKKVTKSTMKKQQLQSQSSLSESDSFPEQEQNNPSPKHMIAGTLQQSQFFANLTKSMNQKEYQAYSACRSVNFVQSNSNKVSQEIIKKFIKFLDEQGKLLKSQMRLFELLSFVCCRIIRKFIFQIIRSRNQGKLKPIKTSITVQEIKKIGNEQIQQFKNNLAKLKQQKRTEIDKARQMFVADLVNLQFQQLLPKKYAVKAKTPQKIQQIWKQNHHYQLMWMERLKGENQVSKKIASSNHIQEMAQQKEQISLKNQYAKYIMKHWTFYNQHGAEALWRKYFSQEKVDDRSIFEEGDKLGKTNKKVKLQSLKN